jgi:chemotaxis-related protein WspD
MTQAEQGRDCWNRIGVYGDRSCTRLDVHAHCRNCEVFGIAAGDVMRRALPTGYLEDWSTHFAQPKEQPRTLDRAVLVFRIGAEWLALPTAMALAATNPVQARRLPHCGDPVLLGIVNLRGALTPCLSLARLLQIDEAAAPEHPGVRVYPRTLAVRFAQLDAALPVSELLGVHRYAAGDLEPPPAAVARAVPRYVTAVLKVGERRVGCLDAELLGQQLARHLK